MFRYEMRPMWEQEGTLTMGPFDLLMCFSFFPDKTLGGPAKFRSSPFSKGFRDGPVSPGLIAAHEALSVPLPGATSQFPEDNREGLRSPDTTTLQIPATE